MRIQLVSLHYPPSHGGVETQTHLLATGLVKRGHQVRVVTERVEDAPLEEELDGVSIERVRTVARTRWRRMAAVIAAFSATIIRERRSTDLVHAQQIFYPAAAAALTARALGIPVLVTNHGSGPSGAVQVMSGLPLGRAVLRSLGWSAHCVALTSAMQAEMRAAGMGEALLVPNGIKLHPQPPRDQRRAAKERLGLAGDVVLAVGRLDREKDHQTLLLAFARLLGQRRATLALVGDGPLRGELEGRARQLLPAAAFRFFGARDDVADFLAAADVFALSSPSEGMSMALLEALAAGLPSVASDVDGNRALLADTGAGLLVPPSDPAALADALVRLLDDRAFAEELGARARSLVERRYSAETMIDAYESIYQRLLEPVR